MTLLSIKAGEKAFALIQERGLQAQDVGAVFAASGAAKWLTISALDSVIFAEWLPAAPQPIHLFGTSIGAWKLAAAAQNNPRQALGDFANAYCHQHYDEIITHAAIQAETDKIIASLFDRDKIQQILNNPDFYFHCGAAACHGLFASESKFALALAMLAASGLNLVQRKQLKALLSRVVFYDPRRRPHLRVNDGITTQEAALNAENFIAAISASGSIPYVMAGVENITGVGPGMYRDGGLIDYHPVPANFWHMEGLILYPHFYSHITPGWFDKSLPWRRANAQQLTNVVLISPSEAFIASLPDQRIPDRQDFVRFKGDNEARIKRWQYCMDQGQLLAQAFLETVTGDNILQTVQPL